MAVETSYCLNEGTIVPAIWLIEEINNHFSDDMFDLSFLNESERDPFIQFTETITCYHKTLDGMLFLGHNQFVTIWRLS